MTDLLRKSGDCLLARAQRSGNPRQLRHRSPSRLELVAGPGSPHGKVTPGTKIAVPLLDRDSNPFLQTDVRSGTCRKHVYVDHLRWEKGRYGHSSIHSLMPLRSCVRGAERGDSLSGGVDLGTSAHRDGCVRSKVCTESNPFTNPILVWSRQYNLHLYPHRSHSFSRLQSPARLRRASSGPSPGPSSGPSPPSARFLFCGDRESKVRPGYWHGCWPLFRACA